MKDATEDGATSASQNRTSWFWLWSKAENAKGNPPADESQNQGQSDAADTGSAPGPAVQVTPATEPSTPNVEQVQRKEVPPNSSGWAFWSREKPNSSASSDTGSTHKQVGELAVADTPSQSHPEAAQFNEHEETAKKEPAKPAKRGRGRIKGQDSVSKPSTPVKGTPSGSPTRKLAEGAAIPQTEPQPQVQPKSPKKPQPQAKTTAPQLRNIILPEFHSTYNLASAPSYWEQLRRFFLGAGQSTPRLHIEPNPPRIQRALAIGVHGFFPAAIFRQVLGQPTGTSIRFANFAAQAIKEWVVAHGDYDVEIEKVALEGEGFITDRVDTLWKLFLNWIDAIRRADFILVAAHSQGVPVAVMLVSKLIQFGCVSSNVRVGICAMAGISMGPFVEYRTSLFGSTANELFEFTRPDSKVSLMYEEALDVVLGHGVRVVYVGSIDDQLVSLESSTFTPITHPYIYRAVFVSSVLQQKPDFIASLVGFALKLRNLGVPDHGLIRELSPALAGNLVSGDGHSRLYDDINVYSLTVRCALETTSLPPGPGAVSATATTASSNPFFLPWAMRGVLEEELVRKELGDECRELLALFESWRPLSKGLKDVRFRLEAVRSKL
ncbi:hypothetical protein NA57DRAFT_31545 [Rhizodiscina lignyota]|uniref:YMC020W-like alpha/beta hydrolase domain-containing protein n=1 Tax=Rhizodiscina lignyota TaxID=1504668 RepID=A0A9P4M950_9PEZI|nr:hypothetical protein NA57DRAFT_31545 [Rhizodiscina lignyota]